MQDLPQPDAEAVDLLWTGGWDSTYRLLEILLVEKKTVRPFYVIDAKRRSTRHELLAMERIRADVTGRYPLAMPRFLASEIHLRGTVPPNAN